MESTAPDVPAAREVIVCSTDVSRRNIVVIGGSAGALSALEHLVGGLPHDLAAALFVVVHTSPTSPGLLPDILSRAGPLRAAHAVDGEPIQHGRIYVAPPDHHLLIDSCGVKLTRGPRENQFRPAVDPLFRTAAHTCGRRVVGVLLSGGLDDGTYGLLLIKNHGGVVIVQEPNTAMVRSMPTSAIQNVDVDYILAPQEMASRIALLTREPLSMRAEVMATEHDRAETPDIAETGTVPLTDADIQATPVPFTCPECGGALWELQQHPLLRYRCHVGHAYSPDGLAYNQDENIEGALWTAVRALEESRALKTRMAARARDREFFASARDFEQQALYAEACAATIRRLLMGETSQPPPDQLTRSDEGEPTGLVHPPLAHPPEQPPSDSGGPAHEKRRAGDGGGAG